MEIDWIWSAVRPLKLRCAPASRFLEADLAKPRVGGQGGSATVAARDSWVQLPNSSDEAFGEALDQRLVVGRLLLDVAKLFMRDLIGASDRAMRENRAAIAGQHCKPSDKSPEDNQDGGSNNRLLLMNPLHVLAAVKRDPRSFDVCSNAYLANEPEP
ncbi:hypothetical protein FBU59_004867 [Linderina macrospora]|uniref:Uncharacterized protein n=1 Tax=Linderina macrospora TaxID=4868 RepID=A0ACC1J4D0_9FUNG|nr:hypothetical protein FBU59_004867 [Linderina macrospora]